ncbi:MAG TPA: flagellar basal body-associated FliL family protein [Lacipirellulaceae bacterium]
MAGKPVIDESEFLDPSADALANNAGSNSGRGGVFTIVKAVAFVSVIVVVEIVAAALLAPSAHKTAKLAQQLAAAAAGETADATGQHGEEHEPSHDEHLKEVELGSYTITRFNPATNTTLAIDFELYGTVLADDVSDFHRHFENSKARIREGVNMTLHGAESSDLTDAGLGLIKRRILEKTNRALGQPLIKEVLFSKFSFVER